MELAQRLAESLKGGEVIAFYGGMGAGKTAFTRGLAIGLGAGDMYRIESWEDLYSTGFFDYLDTDRVLAVEWSENIEAALPDNVIRVEIRPGPEESQRLITILGWEGEL